MKDLTQFINEALNEAKAIPGLGNNSFEDIAWAIYNAGNDGDLDWYREIQKTKSVYDILEYYIMFEDIANELDIDEDEFRDWVEKYDKELCKFLKNAE